MQHFDWYQTKLLSMLVLVFYLGVCGLITFYIGSTRLWDYSCEVMAAPGSFSNLSHFWELVQALWVWVGYVQVCFKFYYEIEKKQQTLQILVESILPVLPVFASAMCVCVPPSLMLLSVYCQVVYWE